MSRNNSYTLVYIESNKVSDSELILKSSIEIYYFWFGVLDWYNLNVKVNRTRMLEPKPKIISLDWFNQVL